MTDAKPDGPQPPPFTSLTARQRRVLGVLLEKGYTTPEYYPLTLKAATTGCNQKSNRDPVVDYDEDTVYEALDQLREMGVVGFVHPESGRTERYRHYLRHCLSLTEPQLAILTELMLRGRQQLGELRTRASRMTPIDNLDQLRDELTGLMETGLVKSGGPLERRGVEVDHNLYPEKEAARQPAFAAGDDAVETVAPAIRPSSPAPVSTESSAALQAEVTRLRESHEELRENVQGLEEIISRLDRELADLRRDLGAG